MDEVPNGSAIFTKDNGNLLWCDRPGCAAARGPRREDMAKEELRPQHKRYDWDHAMGLENCRDLEAIRPRHHGSEKTFRIPPHVEESPLSMKAHKLMLTINQAAVDNLIVVRTDK